MLESIFTNILGDANSVNFQLSNFLACIISAIVVGLIVALFYTYKTKYTKSFFMTLISLPACVAMVIMMVNGSVGTGVAVAGAFSLIRFRSVPGTAKEISVIFLAMGAGLAVGLGYIAFAILFAFLISMTNLLITTSKFGELPRTQKTLLITMPEHLDYSTVFDEIFDKYTISQELIAVKTTSMGSLFKLTYDVRLKDAALEKEFIDQLRCRNGNLEISLTRVSTLSMEL